MKRFGEKAVREAIANGAIIRAWDWYTLEAGYRVIIDDETAGYIVSDLFFKLKNDGTIKKDHWAHSYTDYKAAEEIAAETEKTAEEWAAESERVQEATAAALAAVIATEEAATAAEAAETAQDARTPYERVIAKNPDCPNAWRLPGYPGAVYSITYNDNRGGLWTVHFPTLREYQNEIERLRKEGATIGKTTKTEAGKTEEIPAETYQETTDRENREHCKRIADELEAYAAGSAYKCPYCGNVHTWDEYEASEHENADEETAYTCPSCEWEINECDLEALSLYDFFADCLDIEYRCGSDREYRSVSIMVACGGPNIYIDTAEKAVLLYWWTDRARYYLSSEAVEAVDEWAEEYWNCL